MGKCDERAEPGKNLNVVQAFVVHLYVGTAELELGYDMHTRHRAHFVGASCGPVSGHIIRNRTAVRSDVEGKTIPGNLLRLGGVYSGRSGRFWHGNEIVLALKGAGSYHQPVLGARF